MAALMRAQEGELADAKKRSEDLQASLKDAQERVNSTDDERVQMVREALGRAQTAEAARAEMEQRLASREEELGRDVEWLRREQQRVVGLLDEKTKLESELRERAEKLEAELNARAAMVDDSRREAETVRAISESSARELSGKLESLQLASQARASEAMSALRTREEEAAGLRDRIVALEEALRKEESHRSADRQKADAERLEFKSLLEQSEQRAISVSEQRDAAVKDAEAAQGELAALREIVAVRHRELADRARLGEEMTRRISSAEEREQKNAADFQGQLQKAEEAFRRREEIGAAEKTIAEAKIRDLEQRVTDASKQAASFNAALSDRIQQLNVLEAKLRDAESRASGGVPDEKYQEAMRQIAAMAKQAEDLRGELREEKALRTAADQRFAVRDDASRAEADRLRLREQEMSDELAQKNRLLVDLESRLTERAQQLDHAVSEREREAVLAKAERENFGSKLASADGEIAHLRHQIAAAQAAVEMPRRELDSSRQELANSLGREREQARRLEDLQNQLEEAKGQIHLLTETQQRVQSESARQLADIQTALVAKTETLQKTEARLAGRDTEFASLDQRLQEASERLLALDATRNELAAQVGSLQAAEESIVAYAQKLDAAERELAETKSVSLRDAAQLQTAHAELERLQKLADDERGARIRFEEDLKLVAATAASDARIALQRDGEQRARIEELNQLLEVGGHTQAALRRQIEAIERLFAASRVEADEQRRLIISRDAELRQMQAERVAREEELNRQSQALQEQLRRISDENEVLRRQYSSEAAAFKQLEADATARQEAAQAKMRGLESDVVARRDEGVRLRAELDGDRAAFSTRETAWLEREKALLLDVEKLRGDFATRRDEVLKLQGELDELREWAAGSQAAAGRREDEMANQIRTLDAQLAEAVAQAHRAVAELDAERRQRELQVQVGTQRETQMRAELDQVRTRHEEQSTRMADMRLQLDEKTGALARIEESSKRREENLTQRVLELTREVTVRMEDAGRLQGELTAARDAAIQRESVLQKRVEEHILQIAALEGESDNRAVEIAERNRELDAVRAQQQQDRNGYAAAERSLKEHAARVEAEKDRAEAARDALRREIEEIKRQAKSAQDDAVRREAQINQRLDRAQRENEKLSAVADEFRHKSEEEREHLRSLRQESELRERDLQDRLGETESSLERDREELEETRVALAEVRAELESYRATAAERETAQATQLDQQQERL